MLLTPAWLGIMHGGGGNISVKLNDSNFGGKRMTLITFFFSRRKFIGIFTSNSDLQAISAQLHNWSQTVAISRAQHNCLWQKISEHKKTAGFPENMMTNI